MAGYTIIHLSDLHIGRILSHDPLSTLAEFTAESLVNDFQDIAEKHSITFHPEETLLVVTGDITHHGDWGQYEAAIHFLRSVQSKFAQRMQIGEFPSDHIICIPGNHDIEIPEKESDVAPMQRKTKFRNFKLFLDAVTDHSLFANNFTLTNPFIDVHIPTPFRMHLLDLNTALNISCYGKGEAGSRAFLASDHLRSLEAFLPEQDDAFRIALLHHPLSVFPSEDSGDEVSQGTLRDWLIKRGVKVVLCGHTHVPAGQQMIPVLKEEKSLLELGTGYSFLPGRPSPKGNFYQIIRIEPSEDNRVSLLRRMYSWRVDALDETSNYWGPEKKNNPIVRPEVSNLKGTLGMTDYRDFVGIRSSRDWAVVAHCESGKFQTFGVLSPGEQVNANLLGISGYIEGHLERVDEDSETDWDNYSGKSALFLIDSPHYNPYVRFVLETYGTYLAGGVVQFVDVRSEAPVLQRIQVNRKIFTASKSDDMGLFDRFTDYVLIMRLPGIVPRTGIAHVETPDIDKSRVIWVIAGIHSKASYAGAMLFTPRNLQLFVTTLWQKSGGRLPEYFEAVYRVPDRPERIDDFRYLELVHLKTLRLKSEIGIADDLPSGMAVRFLDQNRWNSIPITTVHLDPVAACNFNCPKCIEKNVRPRNMFLSMSTCAGILCDLRENGCQNLDFYGGEPTLHPDFAQIVRLSSNLGFDMLLVTNGSRLSDTKIAEAIVNARHRIHLRVSMDSHSSESHCHNHGLSAAQDHFGNILTSTEKLIQQDVSVTISFLLHRESIHEIEEACEFWQGKHASALVMRPLTEQAGKTPELTYSEDEKNVMRAAISKYEGFVFVPAWFQNWLNADQPPQEQQREYSTCYSGYYRVAISPYPVAGSSRRSTIVEGVKMDETSCAWLSLCTYRRYDPDFGCEYPQNLRAWCQTERQGVLSRINPQMQCDEVVCCRHEHNRQIHNIIPCALK